MPVDPSKPKLKKRASRKDLDEYRFDGHSRELELKRNRGEVSCAECRRLKIKCDKKIPCQSCQRRGCASLCPNGSLATGQGTRFVLAATEHLHRRIAKLSGRIRQLEDALGSLHAKHSADPHPLLHEDLMVDERDLEPDPDGPDDSTPALPKPPPPQPTEILDAFGTLSISEHGISRFFGPTGGSESLLLANLESTTTSPSRGTPESARDSRSPPSMGPLGDISDLFSQSFPLTPIGQAADVQELIEGYLPPYERATTLCETYFQQVSWIFHGVTHQQLIDDMLPVIYKRRPAPEGEDYSGPHDLSLLFVIFAIGELVGEEPSVPYANHYHQISRVAISLQPVLEKPSIVTIQALHLLSIYNAMSGSDLRSETSMEMTWSLITLAAHLSQTIGLHRDSARWGLSEKMVQRRRILFWDLFVADVWQSLNTGRPPSFSLPYIDCSFPQYDDEQEGGLGHAFEVWQCRFAAECVADVTAKTLTAEAPSYTTIMDLDRKVREFPLPSSATSPSSSSAPSDMSSSFINCVLDHIRETGESIHIFFAQAIIDQPVNPLKSAYAPSFLAAYRSSSTILKSVSQQFTIWPNSCSRFWTMWTFAFSAAVVFGTVVTRGPRSPLAQPAMLELEQACVLFQKAAIYSIRATKALPILMRLNEKARTALASAQADPNPLSGDRGGLLWNIKQEDTDDELAIISGRTRFVSGKRPQDQNPSPPYTSDVSAPPSAQPYSGQHHYDTISPKPPLSASSYVGQAPIVTASSSSSSSSSLSGAWPAVPPPPPPTQPSTSATTAPIGYPPSTPMEDIEDSGLHYGYGRGPEPVASTSGSGYSPVGGHWSRQGSLSEAQPPPNRTPTGSSGMDYHSQMQPPHHLHQQHHVVHPQHPQHHPYHHPQHQPQQYQMYTMNPAGPQAGTPHPGDRSIDLAGLGLASRDSRLDERWSSFMADSGLLEDYRRR